MTESDKARFFAKVRYSSTGCHLWIGAKTPAGYGKLGMRGRTTQYAHRLAYEMQKGVIPDSLQILHSCDNPSCVNPSHLRVGTSADNARDKVQRDRQLKGEQIHNSRLTVRTVREIRQYLASGLSPLNIAKWFGVHRITIHDIAYRRTWAHLT